ncbi:MAG: S8 family serine peptidase [Candidatus Aenigmarchaeota archaeon]|nr:S8 family serine peptidase [Candidatus Aenigmarchaeota archaeon]
MFKRLLILVILITNIASTVEAFEKENFIPLPQHSFTRGLMASVPIGKTKDNPQYVLTSTDIIEPNLREYVSWGFLKIETETFWNLSKGESIKIGILDTGVEYTHTDLEGKVKEQYCYCCENPGFGCDDESPGCCPDGTAVDSDAMDDVGHGTGIAGIIAAKENDIGIVGIAPEAELYVVKVSDEHGAYLSDIVKGLEWCIEKEVDIIVLSMGSDDPSPELENNLSKVYSQGIIIVGAAGNDGDQEPDDDIDYPARYNEVVAAGATGMNDERVSSSSDGPELELMAPGRHIFTTYINNSYTLYSGTSFSAPHVAASIALISSYNRSYQSGELRNILAETSVDLGEEGRDNYYGYGRVNLSAAYNELVGLISEFTTTTPIVTTSTFTTTTSTTTSNTVTSTPTTSSTTSTSTIINSITTITTTSTTTVSTTTSTISTTTIVVPTTIITFPTTTTICEIKCLRWFRTKCLEWSSCDTKTTTTTITTTTQSTQTTTPTIICERRCLWWFRGTCLDWKECENPITTQLTITSPQLTTTTLGNNCYEVCLWWFRAKCLKWEKICE